MGAGTDRLSGERLAGSRGPLALLPSAGLRENLSPGQESPAHPQPPSAPCAGGPEAAPESQREDSGVLPHTLRDPQRREDTVWRQAAGVGRARGDLTSAQPLAASAGRPLCTALCSGSAASSTARWVRSSICLRSGSVVSRNLAEKGCKHRTGQAHGMRLSTAPRARGAPHWR